MSTQHTTSHMQMLPQEVAQMIFAAIQNDVPTLSSCVLVCRSWAMLSYPFRFRSVTFNVLAGLTIPNTTDKGPHSFDDVLLLLQQSPWLRHSIRELALKSRSHIGALDVAVLRRVVAQLPGLSALDLAALVLYGAQPTEPYTALGRRLRQLTFGENCSCESQNTVASVLNFFSSIDAVTHHADQVTTLWPSRDLIVPMREEKLKIKSMSLVVQRPYRNERAVHSALAVYSQLLDPDTLTSFTLNADSPTADDFKSYNRFLGEVGRGLTDFRCGVFRHDHLMSTIDIIPRGAHADIVSVQYSVALEFSPWLQRVITCGWDSAISGLVHAPEGARILRLTFKVSKTFSSWFAEASLTPHTSIMNLWKSLDWSVLNRIVEGRQTLECLQIEVPAAQWISRDAQAKFTKECEQAVLGRFQRDSGVLQIVIV